ncbi:MAG: hypothetical protein V1915_01115 [Candidatus Bathyarchaeota archaeon]
MKPYELERKNVISKEAKELGTVIGIEIDVSTWKVTHLRVGLIDKMLQQLELTLEKKPGEKYVEILISTKTVEIVADLIVLNITVDELKKVIEKT